MPPAEGDSSGDGQARRQGEPGEPGGTADSGVAGGADRRAVLSWCLFDWANSAFPTVIATFVFSAYFTRAIAPDVIRGTEMWGNAVTVSALLIALFGPALGAVADVAGPRKPWLRAFTIICVVATALFWFARPAPESALFALVVFVVANTAFEAGTIFYNAMLPEIAPAGRLGRISGNAWGLGYAGGLSCLVLVLLVFVRAEPAPFGLDEVPAGPVRVVGPVVAIWFALFCLPLFLWVPDRPRRVLGAGRAVRDGLASLGRSLRQIRDHREALKFLFARMIYTDGLNTLFAFGGIFAAGAFDMDIGEVIVFGITLNISAGAGAFLFGGVDDRIGARRTILVALAALVVVGGLLLMAENRVVFWLLAVLLGTFFGPTQAASRSLMARLAPAEFRTGMFGFYAFSGKATAFIGPLILGQVTLATGSLRLGMATTLAFLALGGVLMLAVREPGR